MDEELREWLRSIEEKMDSSQETRGLLASLLTGASGVHDNEVGMSLRLRWVYDRLSKIDASVQRIEIVVMVAAVAVVAFVWRHW